MLLTLANVLDVPLRERNVLLQAAGLAPVYRETSLDDPRMSHVRAVYLHPADKYSRLTLPTFTGAKRPRLEGSHGLPAVL